VQRAKGGYLFIRNKGHSFWLISLACVIFFLKIGRENLKESV
jgi:hypothetical protein